MSKRRRIFPSTTASRPVRGCRLGRPSEKAAAALTVGMVVEAAVARSMAVAFRDVALGLRARADRLEGEFGPALPAVLALNEAAAACAAAALSASRRASGPTSDPTPRGGPGDRDGADRGSASVAAPSSAPVEDGDPGVLPGTEEEKPCR